MVVSIGLEACSILAGHMAHVGRVCGVHEAENLSIYSIHSSPT
jgi:hypothetical protein